MQPIAVSEHLALMPLELRDADELFSLTDRNRRYLRRWLPWLDNITRPEDTRAFIRAAQAQASQNNGTQLAIRLDGRISGIVGHHQIDWRNRLTSLGYWVGEEFQGRGLVTAASRALVSHAFDQLTLVAEPKFLGMLRSTLSHEVSKMVARSLSRNYTQSTPEQIRKVLNAN